MLPDYPAFRAIRLDDQPLFDRFFQQDPPEISELTFANLYGWRAAYGLQIAAMGDWLLLRSRQGLFMPLGLGDRQAAIQRLLQAGEKRLIRVPERIAQTFQGRPGVVLHPDRDNADYIYHLQALQALKGRHFDGKRGLIKKFRKNYAYEYHSLTPALCQECLGFEEVWCERRVCDEDESLSSEREAIRAMLADFERFSLWGGAIRVAGRMVALALAQPLNPDTLVMHVLKALPDMPGLYQTMYQEFLQHIPGRLTWVNMEQDLGLPGLRQAKESYRPSRLGMKYTLSPAAGM